MSQSEPAAGPPRGILAVGVVAVLLAVATLSSAAPTPAFGCAATNNPDGSHSCTQSQSLSCPTTDGGVTKLDVEHFIPVESVLITTDLAFSPGCSGSSDVITYDTNAPSPPPPPGDRTVRGDIRFTCGQTGGCPEGSTGVVFGVTYYGTIPAEDFELPGEPVRVKGYSHAEVEEHYKPPTDKSEFDLTDWVIFHSTKGGVVPKQHSLSATAAAKRTIEIGTLDNFHHTQGATGLVGLHLNSAGRKALRAKGKLRVEVSGKIVNAAGTTTANGNLTLVATRSKKG